MNRSVITCCIEIPEKQDTSCVLETKLDIHEQISYYMLYRDTLVSKAQDVSCVTSISIQHAITDLFMNVKSSL
jgi:hypothetical protein